MEPVKFVGGPHDGVMLPVNTSVAASIALPYSKGPEAENGRHIYIRRLVCPDPVTYEYHYDRSE